MSNNLKNWKPHQEAAKTKFCREKVSRVLNI